MRLASKWASASAVACPPDFRVGPFWVHRCAGVRVRRLWRARTSAEFVTACPEGSDGIWEAWRLTFRRRRGVIYHGDQAIWDTGTVDNTYVASLPHQLVADVRVASGCWVRADVQISAAGKLVGHVDLRNSQVAVGYTAGWAFVLGDQKGNAIHSTKWWKHGINAAGLSGTRKIGFAIDESFPADLAPSIGTAAFIAVHDPSDDTIGKLKKGLDEAVQVGKKVAEVILVVLVIIATASSDSDE